METVTPRQLQVLRFIRDFRRQEGYSPTMQEIGDHLGLTKVTVFEHVAALERKGLLVRGAKHKARSLQVNPEFRFAEDAVLAMPLVGRVVAGVPLEALEDRQTLDIEELLDVAGERFALRVSGDSMIDDHICEGDYVICRRSSEARSGQIVVALLDDGETTLKRFYRERGRIRLQPANRRYEPIFAKQVDIQGVVVAVIRKV